MEDTVEKGEETDDGSRLVLAVKGAENAAVGDSIGAMVVREEGLGLSAVVWAFSWKLE